MQKNEFERKLNKVLEEEETFMLSLILLAHMRDDDKYKNISELIFLFDNYKGFKQFIKFYEGQSINIPTILEIKQALRLLSLFQKVKIDGKDFEKAHESCQLNELKLSKRYCLDEINKFYKYIQKEGTISVKQIRKPSKSKTK